MAASLADSGHVRAVDQRDLNQQRRPRLDRPIFSRRGLLTPDLAKRRCVAEAVARTATFQQVEAIVRCRDSEDTFRTGGEAVSASCSSRSRTGILLAVESITFSDGTKLEVPAEGVVVLVGPNNAGKAQPCER
jgi:hypothetical protein